VIATLRVVAGDHHVAVRRPAVVANALDALLGDFASSAERGPDEP